MEKMTRSEKLMEGVARWCSYYREYPHVFVEEYLGITLRTIIKKYKNEKKITKESDENKKKNLIRYVSNWFLNNLNEMMDKPITVNKEEYEEEIKKYTVELDGDE